MSFAWNITNPGILIDGLPTAAEGAFLTNLTGLPYQAGDLLFHNGTDLDRLESGLPGQILSLDLYSMPEWISNPSLSGYVPYTGATTNLDLGDNNLFTNDLTAKGFMKFGDAIDNVSINRVGPNAFILGGVNTSVDSPNTVVDFSAATVDRTILFPDKDGTILLSTYETVSKNLDASGATLSYTGENLTLITYVSGVIKTFNYTGDNLTSIVLSGSTPSGIDLTKTLSYTGDNLTGISYS